MSDFIDRLAATEVLEREKPTPFVNEDGSIDPFGAGRQNQWYRDGIAIMNLPSAKTEQRWIPCSERLPEDEQNVLVTYKTTDKIHLCQYHDDGSKNPWYSYIDQCRAHMNVVLAWMPLPEPWRGEEE